MYILVRLPTHRWLLTILDQAFPNSRHSFARNTANQPSRCYKPTLTPADVRAAGMDTVAELLTQHSRKHYGRAKAEEVFYAAQRSFDVPFARKALGIQLSLLPGQIAYLEA